MKQINNYQNTKKNLIKQQTANEDIDPSEQQSNQRINSYLKTISKLQANIKRIQQQNLYYETLCEWLSSCSDIKIVNSVQGMKSIMNSSSKLTVLQKQALTSNKTQTTQTESQKQNKVEQIQPKESRCAISGHLKYILSQKDETKLKIKELINQKNNLYKKIQESLIKEEPYMHEKIIKKIQRQVKRQVKMETIRELQRICKSKQEWVAETKEQISNKIDQKIIQQKVTNNLMKMKQVMTQKLNNDQSVKEICNNAHTLEKNCQKIRKSISEVKSVVKQQLQKIKSQALQKQLEHMTKEKVTQQKYIQFDDNLVQQINQLMQEGHQLLAEPLESVNNNEQENRFERLSQEINQLTNRRF